MKIPSLRVVQGTYFQYFGRDYFHLIFIPFIQRDIRFTPILFLLTFYLGTDFCQKKASPVPFASSWKSHRAIKIKLNSLLPLHQTPLMPMTSFQPLYQGPDLWLLMA